MATPPCYEPSAATEVTRDMSGRVCLVTGANAGIGRVTALELARAGGHVFLACRNTAAADVEAAAIREATGNERVEVLHLDLGSLESVRQCAEGFFARGLPLHLLVANAGLVAQKGLTADGFEPAVGVNHIGHFLLVALLREHLVRSAPARVVVVASRAHKRTSGLELDRVREPKRSYTGMSEYAQSKCMNILFARELGRRLTGTGVTTCSLHPGVVASSIWRVIPQPFRWLATRFMLTNEEGARTTLHCATAPEVAEDTGLYYDDCQVAEPTALARDEALAAELWARSLVWVGLTEAQPEVGDSALPL